MVDIPRILRETVGYIGIVNIYLSENDTGYSQHGGYTTCSLRDHEVETVQVQAERRVTKLD